MVSWRLQVGCCFAAAGLIFGCNTPSRRGNTGSESTGNAAEPRAESSAASHASVEPRAPAVQPEPVHPRPGVAATPEALLDFDRINCESTPKATLYEPQFDATKYESFHPWQDMQWRQWSYSYVQLAADDSQDWGRVLRARDANQGKSHAELRPRDYLLGTGAVDECGTITYNGSLWSGFSAASEKLISLPAMPLTATLIDHRKRSSACTAPAAPMLFIENSPGSQAVYRFGRNYGEPLFPRTVYGKGELSGEGGIPRAKETPLAKSGVCPFGPRPGQSYKSKLRVCEVGTYFVEDDLPKFGKLVALKDFGSECKKGRMSHWIAGPRFYILGAGRKDPCGSVTYEPFRLSDTPFLEGQSRSVGHRLEMVDHRMRNQSKECPPQSAAVELHETVVVSPTLTDPQVGLDLFRRSFYAPTELQTERR